VIFGNKKKSMKYYNSKLCTFIQVHFKNISRTTPNFFI